MRFAHEYTDTDNRTVADVVQYQEERIGAHARQRKLLEQRVIDLEEDNRHIWAELEELRAIVGKAGAIQPEVLTLTSPADGVVTEWGDVYVAHKTGSPRENNSE